ncbi:RNA-binding protein (KH domain) [Desulfobacula phenolica]|uniref:RNA-binding protein KhpA n=2 Tax=Desulfobacula phenolica TaxID=90732 RepID=A0A1H2IFF8_9BACT|nr:RNA-binding protein (KH domain) [Desulfobacula phenolica]
MAPPLIRRNEFGMKTITKKIVQVLVDEPELVCVTEICGKNISILELQVSKSDVGKVIGKQGRTANALRIILSAVSAKAKKRVVLEIID